MNATALCRKLDEALDCARCPLRRCDAFLAGDPEERRFIENFRLHEVRVPAGFELLLEGGRSDYLYTLREGWAFRYRAFPDGRRQIFNFLLPGDFIGLQAELMGKIPHGIETLTEATFCVFPREGLWRLFRSFPGVAYDITWLNAREESMVDENLLSVGRRTALERVATLLIDLAKRAESLCLAKNGAIPFPLKQQHIADALGLSLAHTNKTMRRLEKMGFHEILDDTLRLMKPKGLERLAEYRALPLRKRPLV